MTAIQDMTAEAPIETRPVARPDTAAGPDEAAPGSPWVRRVLVRAVLTIGVLQAVVGVFWWVRDLVVVPAYGDTVEYERLAQVLHVDGWRTLAYPILVRLSDGLSHRTGLPWQLPLYLSQTALAVAVSWYLVRSVSSLDRRRSAWATAVIATSPLVVHYATSVLTDSFASSFFVLGLVGLGRVIVGRERRVMTWLLAAVGVLGAALMRAEKVYVLLGVALVIFAVALVRVRSKDGAMRRLRAVSVALVVLVVLPLGVALGINRSTQTADLGRPQAGLVPSLVSRVVWGHMAQIRDDLPARARAGITEQDALGFDQTPTVTALIERMRQLDGGGDAIVWASIRAGAACCAVTTAAATGWLATELSAAPVVFAWEGTNWRLSGEPQDSSPNIWDYTRMSDAHPQSADLLVALSLGLLALLTGTAVALRMGAGPRAAPSRGTRARARVLLLVAAGTVINNLFFASVGGGQGNVRYGLGSAMVIVCALAVWLFPGERVSHR